MRIINSSMIFLIFLLTQNYVSAQGAWTSYVGNNLVNSIKKISVEGNIVWCATEGGVVSWSTNTGEYKLYTIDDGLADNFVYTVAIDNDGVKWFGTPHGISTLNGETWKIYADLKDVFSIAVDKRNNMKWFSSSSLVMTSIDGDKWTNFSPLFYGSQIGDIAIGDDGIVWATPEYYNSTYYGVLCYKGEKWESFRQIDGLAGDHAVSVAIDADNAKWFATRDHYNSNNKAVSRLDTLWTTFTTKDGLISNEVNDIAVDTKNTKWFATVNGVSSFNGTSWKSYSTVDGLANNYVNTVQPGNNGTIWFGTTNGLSGFDGTKWVTYRVTKGLPYNAIKASATDKNGVKWFSVAAYSYTVNIGVARFDGSRWDFFDSSKGLASNDVRDIDVDSNNNIWFATSNGVSRYDGDKWTTFNSANGLASNNVYDVTVAPDGRIWFGTTMGATVFNGTSWKTYTTTDGLNANGVNRIFIEKSGIVWFSTLIFDQNVSNSYPKGITRFDGKKWENITKAWHYDSQIVYDITQDGKGVYWFVGEDGLSSLDGTQWTYYYDRKKYYHDGTRWIESIENNNYIYDRVYSIAVDSHGYPFFGSEWGLYNYNEGKWSKYDSNSGLINTDVRSLTFDHEGLLWCGTERGISVYRPELSVPFIHIVSPNSMEVLKAHFSYTISWESSDSKTLKIEYSADNGKTWNLIARGVNSELHSFQWILPDIASTECLVKISDEDNTAGYDISNGVFTIRKELPHALLFDGKNDDAYFVNRPYLNPETLTLECWVNFKDIDTSGILNSKDGMYYQYIISKAQYGNGGYAIYQRRASYGNVLVFQLSGKKMVSPVLDLKSDVWYHIACSYDGELMKLYLNGELIQQESFTGYDTSDISISSVWSYIGRDSNNNYYFKGILDELRYWNITRTHEEINETMKKEIFSVSGLIAAWHFNEGNGEFSANSTGEISVVLAGAEPDMPEWVDSTAPVNGLRLFYPNGGEQIKAKNVKTIKWGFDKPNTIKILFSANRGSTWDIVAQNIDASIQSYNFEFPDINSDGCFIKIVDESDTTHFDQSDASFIVSPFVSVDTMKPMVFNVSQNYPNPFNMSTVISFNLPSASPATLEIYNVTGQRIKTFTYNKMSPGTHSLVWNAQGMPSGIYFYSMKSGEYSQMKKMMLLK